MKATQQHIEKRLGELVDDEHIITTYANVSVSGLAIDSRKVTKGDVFLAYPGYGVDGRDFINAAVKAGAAAVLAAQDETWNSLVVVEGIPVIPIERLNEHISIIASRFYGHPSHYIPIFAVTGTNGKTSCTQLMMQLFNSMQKRCGVIGTLGAGVDGQLDNAINTTPDAVSIQRYLKQWSDDGIDTIAMEVSSHGLEQHRVAAVQFQLALFTNLSRDHLDYHGSMQAYALAKSKLFTLPGLQIAVINIDDPYSSRLIELLPKNVKFVSYSIRNSCADFYVDDIRYHKKGVDATLCLSNGEFQFSSPLLGAFNLSNVVGVIASLISTGCDVNELLNAVSILKTVSGRMEHIAVDADISVVVDYAHTPDALDQALTAMKLHCGGKLWCVFGCGGDRDHGKRQQMGEVAQRHADYVVVTSDNPRSEPPNAIIDDILCGIDIPTQVEVDRAAAIKFAITHAKPTDSILIAGKGHEQYQHIGDQMLPFSDIEQAKIALKCRETE